MSKIGKIEGGEPLVARRVELLDAAARAFMRSANKRRLAQSIADFVTAGLESRN